MPRHKIAIIGSGCSGMAAAWALRDTDAEVHVFEKSSKLGGHTNTQPWQHKGLSTPVDTGFIVLNTATYPNFIRFLEEIGIEPAETEMTFGVSRDHGKFEWSGEPKGIFAQRRNLLRFRHWHLLFDIVRFNQFALDILSDDDESESEQLGTTSQQRRDDSEMSIGEYLDQHGYSAAFREDYLIPMTAAVWSTSPDKASLAFPAKTLIRFMWNHHLLSTLAARPPWLTIPGGAQRYIDSIVNGYPEGRLHLHTSCEVVNVLRPSKSKGRDVLVSWVDATSRRIDGASFSHVIFACHGDQILPILSGSANTYSIPRSPSNEWRESPEHDNVLSQTELEVLSSFETSPNTCYLHSDLSLMPRRRAAWTSWNYLTTTSSKAGGPDVSLTYNMNILQHIPVEKFGHVLVTMNPDTPPAPALTQGKFNYRHPLYTSRSVRAQRALKSIQNTRRVSYSGAWTNYGFHEDGFSSGLRVAMDLGAELPFESVDSTFSRGHRPLLSTKDHVLRLVLTAILHIGRIVGLILAVPGVSMLVHIIGIMAGAMLDLLESTGLFE